MNRLHQRKSAQIARRYILAVVLALANVVLQGAVAAQPNSGVAGQYLVEFKGGSLPDDLSARVTALGGTIVDRVPELKVAILANMSADAADALRRAPDV